MQLPQTCISSIADAAHSFLLSTLIKVALTYFFLSTMLISMRGSSLGFSVSHFNMNNFQGNAASKLTEN